MPGRPMTNQRRFDHAARAMAMGCAPSFGCRPLRRLRPHVTQAPLVASESASIDGCLGRSQAQAARPAMRSRLIPLWRLPQLYTRTRSIGSFLRPAHARAPSCQSQTAVPVSSLRAVRPCFAAGSAGGCPPHSTGLYSALDAFRVFHRCKYIYRIIYSRPPAAVLESP